MTNIPTKTTKVFLDVVPWENVIKKAMNASRGQRLFPSSSSIKDKNLNYRIDKGSMVDGKPELILQANKNAKDRNVREAAQKDSHAIVGKVVADPVADPTGQKAKEQLEANVRERK